MIGGTVTTGTGLLTLNGDVTYNDSPVLDGTIADRLSLGTVSRAFNVIDGTLNLTANVESSGTAGITKERLGTLALWGTNTYTGPTVVNGGELDLRNNQALGAPGTGAQSTTVNGGGSLDIASGITITGELLQFDSEGFLFTGGIYAEGPCSWNGDVFLTGDSSIQVGSGLFTISGIVYGPGSLTKVGAGNLRFAGSSANTFTGSIFVDQGILSLNKSAGVTAISGALTVGNDLGGADADVVRLLADDQIADNAPITLNSSGLLDINGHVEVLGPLTFNGGHLDSGNPNTSVWLGGDVTVNANINAQAIMDGGIFFYGNTNRIFNTVDHYWSPDIRVNAFVSGQTTAALVKTGVGELGLYHTNNSYLGLTLVQQGSLQVYTGAEPGSSAGGVIVSNGAAFGLLFGARVAGESLTLYGTPNTPGAYSFFGGFGSNWWGGPIILAAGTSTVSVFRTNDTLNLGHISGPGGLAKIGPGWLGLLGTSSNSFAGGTFVNEGHLVLAHTAGTALPGPLTIGDGVGGANADVVHLTNGVNQLPTSARIIVNSSGLFDVWADYELAGSLEGSGNVSFDTGILAVGYNGLNTTFSGQLIGSGGFNQAGPGTLRLTGDSALFTGTLYALDGGTLLVDSAFANAGAQSYGGVLGGTGSVQSLLVYSNAFLSPGESPGRLTVLQDATFYPTATYNVELNGTTAGVNYDQLSVGTTLVLSNATLAVTLGFNSAPNDAFTIIRKVGAGAVNGIFNGLPQNALLTVNGQKFRISYTGGSGNDVVLTHIDTAPLLSGVACDPLKPEGSFVNLHGGFIEPDAGDTLHLVVNWGDGAITTNDFPGTTTLFSIAHLYTDDNPSGTSQDTYALNAYVYDSTGASSPAVNLSTIISNVPPVVSLGPDVGLPAGRPLSANGRFSDPGADSWTATVNYGDGTGSIGLPLNSDKTFALNHTFPSNGLYSVTVIVRDDDLGVGSATLKAAVGLQLAIAPTSTNYVALTWPSFFTGFALESATSLPAANWTPIPDTPNLVGSQWLVAVPATNTARFFRLVEQ
jgi:autotransporter-associated beta strand protein